MTMPSDREKGHKNHGSSLEEEQQQQAHLCAICDQRGTLRIVKKLAIINKKRLIIVFYMCFLLCLVGFFVGCLRLEGVKSTFADNSMNFTFPIIFNNNSMNSSSNYPKRDEYILNCTSSNMTITCPANYPPTSESVSEFTSNQTCPEYFRWIHEDLKNWKEKGIEQQMVESLRDKVHFRVVIVNGTAYVKRYDKENQTRDTLTLWGILQLLKLYPGRIADLDLMFRCHDKSNIKRDKYPGEQAAFAPPQFHFCADESTFDIIFPDLSFWGWSELNIKPWVALLPVKDLEEGNSMKNWTTREPFAFWKGNTHLGSRKRLRTCKDWYAQIVHQAQEIGKAGNKFIFYQIKIEHVYDYMFHVLNEYAKLLKYKPTVPEGAIELCSETFACSPTGLETDYKIQTMVNGPAKQGPCNLPPLYDPNSIQTLRDQKARIMEVVEMWDESN